MNAPHVLYITYDGLTDPLGQSQVLPYIIGLSKLGYRFTILSFEKKDRFLRERSLIENLTSTAGIRWVPLSFTTKPPVLGKAWDVYRMRRKAVALQRKSSFAMVHCRSYIAADVGLYLKKRFGVRFFFDMRGFWADEKKDGGSWDQKSLLFRNVYRYYKKKEAAYLQHADFLVSLTEAGKNELRTWSAFNPRVPINVIPCCTDLDHFSLTDATQKQASRAVLGLPEDALVLSYLGSVGTWYMLDEMLEFFREVKKVYPRSRFLFVTHTPRETIDKRIIALGINPEDVHITQASRKEVPALVKASDINVSFIRPVYSKISSSPTKLGEVLAMGIPVIVNSGVGDVEQIVNEAQAGYVLKTFTPAAYLAAVEAIPDLLRKSPAGIRQAIHQVYSLDNGIQSYHQSYKRVLDLPHGTGSGH